MISAVIPVFNEVGHLERHVPTLATLLEGIAGNDWEIVLVDDGSTDGTPDIIRHLARDAHIVGLTHPVNRGKGAAVCTGMVATRGEAAFFCDADMSTPPETLTEFLEALEAGADVVIGNRKSREATIERWQSPLRTWLGLGYTRLANAIMGLSINDYTCGFKLFRGEAARTLFGQLDTARWCFDVEVLARAVRSGMHIVEVPVVWHHVEDTRVRVARDVVQSFVELFAIRRKLGKVPKGSRS
jgi:dolichyl-phosphate beta-glucosyltransferase